MGGAEVSSSLELGRENARKGLSGPGKGREPGHWDRNVHDKIKACCLLGLTSVSPEQLWGIL